MGNGGGKGSQKTANEVESGGGSCEQEEEEEAEKSLKMKIMQQRSQRARVLCGRLTRIEDRGQRREDRECGCKYKCENEIDIVRE